MVLALGMCKRKAIPERSTVHQKIPMQRRRAIKNTVGGGSNSAKQSKAEKAGPSTHHQGGLRVSGLMVFAPSHMDVRPNYHAYSPACSCSTNLHALGQRVPECCRLSF